MPENDLKMQLAGLFSGLEEVSAQNVAPGQEAQSAGEAARAAAAEGDAVAAPSGLTEIEHLYRASVQLNRAQSYDDILTVLREHTLVGRQAQYLNLNYFNQPWSDARPPEGVIVLAHWGRIESAVFPRRYLFEDYGSLGPLLKPNALVLIEDVAGDARLDEALRQLYQRAQAKSVLLIPLIVAGQWLGFLNALYTEPITFPKMEMRLLLTLVSQAAIVIQNLHNVEQAQTQARREECVRAITNKIRQAGSTQAILQTTLEELNQMLGASKGIIRLGTQAQLLMKHAWTKSGDKAE